MHSIRHAHVRAAVGLAIVGSLLGCASGFPGARPLTYATPGEARVFASPGKCPHDSDTDEAAGLVAALLTGVASQLLTNFGTALQKGAEGGNLPSSVATLNMTLPPGAVPRCIVVVRGAFDTDKRNPTLVNVEALFGGATDPERKKRLGAFNFPPMYRVDHLIEIQVVSSANSKALTFAPIFVRLDKSIDGAHDGERDISVSVKFNRPGTEGIGSAVVISDRLIGQAPTTQKRDPNTKRFPREAPWFATFHAASASAAAGAATKPAAPAPAAQSASGVVGGGGAGAGGVGTITGQPSTTLVSVFSDAADSVPVTLTTTVVETRPTNEGLAFIASVFGAIKPKLEEAIKPVIDPSIADAAEQTAAASALTAEAEYSSAYAAAEMAVLKYCTGASKEATPAGQLDRLTKSSEARVAQLKANAAAVKLGKPSRPYATIIQVSAEIPGSATAGCAA